MTVACIQISGFLYIYLGIDNPQGKKKKKKDEEEEEALNPSCSLLERSIYRGEIKTLESFLSN